MKERGSITLKYLQEYIKAKDYSPDLKGDYFLKLSEEVGELARAMRKSPKPATDTQIKGTIEEELWDVIYYALALANCYEIDMERWIPVKEKINNEKYNTGITFNPVI
jgi:NTP pyrophosphatase (non-canonical NTP hydrolase)